MIYDRHLNLQSKWDKAFWARGYCVATIGNVTEAAIKKYFEELKGFDVYVDGICKRIYYYRICREKRGRTFLSIVVFTFICATAFYIGTNYYNLFDYHTRGETVPDYDFFLYDVNDEIVREICKSEFYADGCPYTMLGTIIHGEQGELPVSVYAIEGNRELSPFFSKRILMGESVLREDQMAIDIILAKSLGLKIGDRIRMDISETAVIEYEVGQIVEPILTVEGYSALVLRSDYLVKAWNEIYDVHSEDQDEALSYTGMYLKVCDLQQAEKYLHQDFLTPTQRRNVKYGGTEIPNLKMNRRTNEPAAVYKQGMRDVCFQERQLGLRYGFLGLALLLIFIIKESLYTCRTQQTAAEVISTLGGSRVLICSLVTIPLLLRLLLSMGLGALLVRLVYRYALQSGYLSRRILRGYGMIGLVLSAVSIAAVSWTMTGKRTGLK